MTKKWSSHPTTTREKTRFVYGINTLVYKGAATEDLQKAGNLRPSRPINMQALMQQVVKVNVNLWEAATKSERQWIHGGLVSAGLLKRNALIQPSGDADLLEIAEIDMKVKKLEARHAGTACAGRCKKAYTEAMQKCATIIFAEQRRRYKNVAYQAYALCLQNCCR